MLSALLPLASLLPSLQADDAPSVRVLARDADGFGVAAVVTPERPWPVPIPLVTRSEVVRRAVPGPDGLALRLEGLDDPGAVTVEAVAHPVDHQVLIVGGEPVLVGPPLLPRSAEHVLGDSHSRGRRDALPLLARQDGVAVTAPIRYEPPAVSTGMDLFGIWRDDPRTARRVPGDQPPAPLRGGRPIDQLFFARAAELPTAERLRPACDPHEAGLTLTLPRPAGIGPGDAWTVLVRVDLARAGRPARPVEAASPAPALFRDATELFADPFSHLEGPDEQLDIRPTMGPGLAWGDVDLDGRVDLYLVQGGGRAGSETPTNRTYWNAGDGFLDATWLIGGDDRGDGMGALFLDGDGDGDLDLYVANYGADTLFANAVSPDDHTGPDHPELGPLAGWRELTDVGAAAGVPGEGNADKWSAGIAASDYDADGDLDLYVTSYLVYDPASMPPVEELAYQREDPIEMLPFAFPGQANTFYRNESDATGMRFVDVTAELGVADEEGRGMQPIFLDFDRDGDDDLYVANDVSYNVLFRNEGDGTFKDVSFSTGLDDPRGGMGLATGDVDLDGDEDVFLTNWELEPNALYVNNLLRHDSQRHHVATFRDAIVRSGLGPAGIGATSWGAELFDLENDGDLDLFVANGYTSPDYESTGICVGQPNHLFVNDGTGRFVDASAKAGPDVLRRLPSRAAVGCDFDQDGDVDLAVTANNGPLQLLRNELPAEAKGHWLLVRLRGAGGNTHGVGAEVTVRAGERAWRRQLRAGTSYLGGNPPELHFGLGAAETVDAVEVRWPSGATTTHALEGVDRVVVLAEE